MARRVRTTPAAPRPGRTLTAASFAHRIGDPARDGERPPTLRSAAQWQRQAWDYYNTTGELHYAATYLGNGMSMARLYVAEINDEGAAIESTTGEAVRLSRSLLGGPGQQSRILHAYGVQRMVAGQSLLTVHDTHGWRLYPDQNFTVTSRGGRITYRVNGSPLDEGTLGIMLWAAHPGDTNDIDSPVRAALGILREIQQLDSYVYTTLLSRLVTAGILKIPEGSEVPELDEVPDGVHPYMAMLQAAMEAAIRDPDSAAARVPITVEVPAGETIEHLTLDFPLTDSVDSKREAAIRRLAMSMDMPPEILMGMTDTNRSTAWQIDESSVKLHIEPALRDLCSALTTSYLQPLMGDDRYIVDYDISELQIRPDRTDSAIALYDRGEIDGEALREETGLRDYEAPEGRDLLAQMVKAALRANPDLARLGPVFDALGIDVAGVDTVRVPSQRHTPAQLDPPTNHSPAPAATPPPPTDEANRERTPTPVAQDARLAALTAACDQIVMATLKVSGKRWIKARSSRHAEWRGVDEATIYLRQQITADCLQPGETERGRADRYIGSLPSAERAAIVADANPTCVRETVREYIASLLIRRRAHELDALRAALSGCLNA